ncbi:head maturation protease, ClpP-related [Clostridium tagluense]|uniref:head maturation protease, ClpP-related n=1 Tax=Clostridium tagluense TaxID=360422 RepID=UPI001C6EF8AC|nr:head maturation protease, ClpP-related [Clostridium tagluense]MBW9154867.1 Clp protease ClpP [Clostridium tagluense]WLC64322.1 Clp protease ClpP [Clostridium tagluense]
MTKFYNFIDNKTTNTTELYVYGEIIGGTEKWEDSDVTFKDFKDTLELVKDNTDLNIYINSPGGSVLATQGIISLLKRAKTRGVILNAYLDGLSASCASWLPMICDNIYVYDQSILMIHKPMSGIRGNADDMRKSIEILDKIEETMLSSYMLKAKDGVTEENIKNMLTKETWLTAKEIDNIFNITLLEDKKELVACVDKELFKNYKNIPEQFKNKLISENDKTEKVAIDNIENEQLKLAKVKLQLALM